MLMELVSCIVFVGVFVVLACTVADVALEVFVVGVVAVFCDRVIQLLKHDLVNYCDLMVFDSEVL